jgi:WD40 repeat protein
MPTKPSCLELQELSRLARGELPEDQAVLLRRHVRSCPACASALAAHATDETLITGPVAPAGPATPAAEGTARVPAQGTEDPPGGRRAAGVPTREVAGRAPPDHEPPAPPAPPQAADYLAPPQAPGEIGRLGPYRVLAVLGAGDVGLVFEAEDPQLRRTVALKALRLGPSNSALARERFLREAQRTASLEHDNIIEVHEVGEDRGVMFLAMRLPQGETLERRLRRAGRLSIPDVLHIGRQAAEGLAAAHAREVIHGDLKPANIWLETGLPGAPARVKLLDIGLARVLAPLSASSPVPHDDLLSLGRLLYRAATGPGPLPDDAIRERLRALAEGGAGSGGSRAPDGWLPRPLAALILRLLARDPADRFGSTQEAVEALARAELELCPPPAEMRTAVRARPPSGSLTAQQPGPTAPARLPRPGWRSWLLATGALCVLGLLGVLVVLLLNLPRRPGPKAPPVVPPPGAPRLTAADRLRREDIPPALLAAAGGPRHKVPSRVVAILGTPNVLAPSGTYRPADPFAGAFPWNLALSPDGTTLALGVARASFDGEVRHEFRLSDVLSGKVNRTFPGRGKGHPCVAFSPDARALAVGFGTTARVLDPADGKVRRVLAGHESLLHCVTFSADGKRLATGSCDGTARVWDAGTGVEESCHRGHRGCVCAVAFFPDGGRLVSGSRDQAVRVWELAGGKEALSLQTPGMVLDVAVSPDGKRLAAGWGPEEALTVPNPRDRRPGRLPAAPGPAGVIVWDSTTGRELYALRGNPGFGPFFAFSPDGEWLAACDRHAGTIKLWDAASGQETRTLGGLAGPTGRLAFRADGRQLVASGVDGTVARWDLPARKREHRGDVHAGPVQAVAVSPDGALVASAGVDRTVRLWDVASGKCLASLEGHTGSVRQVLFAPSGATLASAGDDGTIRLWDVAARKELRALRGHATPVLALAFHRDGRRLASAGSGGKVRLWDPASGREVRAPLQGHTGPVNCLALSAEEELLASGGKDQTLRIWELATGAAALTLPGQAGEITALAFAPTGQALVSADSRGTIKLWDLKTGKERPLTGHKGRINALAFRPLGPADAGQSKAVVASTGEDGTARLWDLDATLPRPTTHYLFPDQAPVNGVAFSPEGRHFVTANQNGTLYIVRIATPPGG